MKDPLDGLIADSVSSDPLDGLIAEPPTLDPLAGKIAEQPADVGTSIKDSSIRSRVQAEPKSFFTKARELITNIGTIGPSAISGAVAETIGMPGKLLAVNQAMEQKALSRQAERGFKPEMTPPVQIQPTGGGPPLTVLNTGVPSLESQGYNIPSLEKINIASRMAETGKKAIHAEEVITDWAERQRTKLGAGESSYGHKPAKFATGIGTAVAKFAPYFAVAPFAILGDTYVNSTYGAMQEGYDIDKADQFGAAQTAAMAVLLGVSPGKTPISPTKAIAKTLVTDTAKGGIQGFADIKAQESILGKTLTPEEKGEAISEAMKSWFAFGILGSRKTLKFGTRARDISQRYDSPETAFKDIHSNLADAIFALDAKVQEVKGDTKAVKSLKTSPLVEGVKELQKQGEALSYAINNKFKFSGERTEAEIANAIQERRAAKEVPPLAGTGEDVPGDSGRIRPGEQGIEAPREGSTEVAEATKTAEEALKAVDRRVEQLPVEGEKRVEDRRQATTTRARVEELVKEIPHMTQEQATQAVSEITRMVHLDELTGLGNKRAWGETLEGVTERGEYVGTYDAKGLKWINDTYGHQYGDVFLKTIGDAFRSSEHPEGFTRPGGDEFWTHSKTPEAIYEATKRVESYLKEHPVEIILEDGGTVRVSPRLAYGIGKTVKEAESALHVHQEQLRSSGADTGRGSEPPGVLRTPPRTQGAERGREVLPEPEGKIGKDKISDLTSDAVWEDVRATQPIKVRPQDAAFMEAARKASTRPEIADFLGGQHIYEKAIEKMGLGKDPSLPQIAGAVRERIGKLGTTIKETSLKIYSRLKDLGKGFADRMAAHLHDVFGGTERGQTGAVNPEARKERRSARKIMDAYLKTPVYDDPYAGIQNNFGGEWIVEPEAKGPRPPVEKVTVPTSAQRDKFASLELSPKAVIPRWARDLTPRQKKALENVGGIAERPTIGSQAWKLTKEEMSVQKWIDDMAPLKKLDREAYIINRMARGSDGTLEAYILFGNLKLKDGIPDVDAKKGKGLIDIMQGLQGEQERFMWWMAAQRAERLSAEGREHLFGEHDIAELRNLNKDKMPDGSLRAAAYEKASREIFNMNKSLLDFCQESGIIDAKSRPKWEKEFYVNFKRETESGKIEMDFGKDPKQNLEVMKQLKGGSEKLQQDLIHNMTSNWAALIVAAGKNRAAKASLSAASQQNIATRLKEYSRSELKHKGFKELFEIGKEQGLEAFSPNINVTKSQLVESILEKSRTSREGMPYYLGDKGNGEHGRIYYKVEDPSMLSAIMALERMDDFGTPMKIASKFKRALTVGVTASPTFKVRNLIRDTLTSVAIADKLSPNVFKNVWEGGKIIKSKKSQEYASLLASGGIIRFGTMTEGQSSKHIQRLINSGVKSNTIITKWEHVVDALQKSLDMYNNIGDISEGANRASRYIQGMAQGETHAEAAFAARDMLDFTMSGNGKTLRYLTTTVPFLNARIQGTYRLGRAMKENPGRFGGAFGAVATASIGLMLAYKDDKDWKNREDYDRDNFWWFKIGGIAFRIPKPFELGAMGTLAERGAELWVDDEMTKERFYERLKVMLGSTFALNPTPQAIKPWLDIYSNKDPFTGRPIESAGMERLEKPERYTPGTSEAAKLLGKAGQTTELSPAQIDYLVRGYLGWLGTAILTASNEVIRPVTQRGEQPERKISDMLLVGGFVETLPSSRNRYITQFYDQSVEIEEAYNTWRTHIKSGDEAKAAAQEETHPDMIGKYKLTTHIKKSLGKLTREMHEVMRDPSMSGKEKRKRLMELEQEKGSLVMDNIPKGQ